MIISIESEKPVFGEVKSVHKKKSVPTPNLSGALQTPDISSAGLMQLECHLLPGLTLRPGLESY